MWRCAKCGKENQDNRGHCWHCATVKDASPPEAISVVQEVASPANVKETPKVCSECSASLDIDARFCPSCAAPVLLHSTLNCPKCGKSVSATSKFCKYCAADLTKKEQYSYSSNIGAPRYDSFRGSSGSLTPEKLMAAGGILTIVSAFAYLWGASYLSNVTNVMSAGLSSLTGRTDPTYTLAGWAVNLGGFGFFVGLIILIVGVVMKYSNE